MRLTPVYLALALSFGVTTPLLANTTKPQMTQTKAFTEVEGITEYRLKNGMRVLLAADASKPTTTVNVTYLVGSRHEQYGETGMAHLLEHLVFKGTKTRANIMQELGKRGMQFNGTTFFDRTNYFETFQANDDNLKWALEMEADRMVNSNIALDDLKTEFSVVRNEMEMGENNPFRVLWKQLGAVSFDWHNYGNNTIGARSDVEGVHIKNLQAFYRQYYQPDNAVLIVAGKFDPTKTLALIEKTFGTIKKPTRQLTPTWTREAPRDGVREVTVKRVGDMQMAAVLYPTSAGSHADAAAMAALGDVLGNTPNGRLHKQLVESKKAVGVANIGFDLAEPGYTMFLTQLSKEQDITAAKAALIATVEGVTKQPITEDELKRAKTNLLNQIEQTINDPQRLCVEMSESIAMGDWRLFFLQRDRIEALTVADVQRVAANYFKEDNRSYGQYLPVEKPDRTEIPATPDVAQLVKEYKGRAAVAQGEAFDVSPLNIDKRTEKSQLSNGAKVALLSKKTRGETVAGQITLRLGNEQNLMNQSYNLDIATNLLLRGTQQLPRAELEAKLAELKANVNVFSQGQAVVVMFDTVRSQLPAVIDIIRDVLKTPAFSQQEFDLLIDENVAQLESQRSEPQAIVADVSARAKNVMYKKGDLRYADTLDEGIAEYKAAKLDAVRAFHQHYFGINNGEIVLVGDFDATAVKTQLNNAFGNWSSSKTYARVPTLAFNAAGNQYSTETPDKANAAYFAEMPLTMTDESPDFVAMLVVNKVLGGGTKSRLLERLRQKEGISYGAGSRLNVMALDNAASLNLQAIYAPQNLAKLKQGISEELARLVKDGITAEELSDAKQALMQERHVRRAQDAALAGTLRQQLFLGRSMQFDAGIDSKIEQLSLVQVNTALRQYLKPENFTHYYAGDFAGAEKKAVSGKSE